MNTFTFDLVCVDDLEVFPKQGCPPTEEELNQFFLSFRGICARKGVLKTILVSLLRLS